MLKEIFATIASGTTGRHGPTSTAKRQRKALHSHRLLTPQTYGESSTPPPRIIRIGDRNSSVTGLGRDIRRTCIRISGRSRDAGANSYSGLARFIVHGAARATNRRGAPRSTRKWSDSADSADSACSANAAAMVSVQNAMPSLVIGLVYTLRLRGTTSRFFL